MVDRAFDRNRWDAMTQAISTSEEVHKADEAIETYGNTLVSLAQAWPFDEEGVLSVARSLNNATRDRDNALSRIVRHHVAR